LHSLLEIRLAQLRGT